MAGTVCPACSILSPVAVLFLLGYRSAVHRFKLLNVLLGWLVVGLLVFQLFRPDPIYYLTSNSVWLDSIGYFLVYPSVGAVSWVCGMRYHRRPHWKYLMFTGGWLIIVAYAYAVYDYYRFCGWI